MNSEQRLDRKRRSYAWGSLGWFVGTIVMLTVVMPRSGDVAAVGLAALAAIQALSAGLWAGIAFGERFLRWMEPVWFPEAFESEGEGTRRRKKWWM